MEQIKIEQARICRTCLSVIEGSNYIHLTGSENPSEHDVLNMLNVYVPEIVVNRVVDPVMCHPCFTVLCSYHEFRKICSETEEKINNGQFVSIIPNTEGYSVYIKDDSEQIEVKEEDARNDCIVLSADVAFTKDTQPTIVNGERVEESVTTDNRS